MRDCNSSVTPGKFDTLEGILLVVKSDTDGTSGEGLKKKQLVIVLKKIPSTFAVGMIIKTHQVLHNGT